MLDVREPVNLSLRLDKTDTVKPKNQTADAKHRQTKRTQKENLKNQSRQSHGLKITPRFTKKNVHPFNEIEWERRKAFIQNDKGEMIFERDNVEVPKTWSMLATNVVASKYLYDGSETHAKENSVRKLIHRVACTIKDWGLQDGYFDTQEDADTFYHELIYICLHQYAAFNSPTWFNVGLHHVYGISSKTMSAYYWNSEKNAVERTSDSYKHPQSSACFIQSVEDTMEDIMRLATSEAMLFKYGSGTGTDLSTLRSSREKLSSGGTPSGPLSFMRVFDQVAAVIKSGGKTRRAAKMQSLKVEHPDIIEFINCKVNEEKKARALIKSGYDASFNGEAYSSVMFQNANLSIRVSEDFMKAAEAKTVWHTHAVTTGEIIDVLDASTILKNIADAAHFCGDPGLQYDTAINRWHTCPNSGRINASNPCSEYMFINNSACNLASINLTKFYDEHETFNTEAFNHVARIMIIAQDILIDNASYPSREIAENSHRFRPLGLGYANLGALIMSLGKPYDSDEGRTFASAVTALLTGCAYATSSEIAAVKGTFDEYEKNSKPMMKVIRMHCDAVDQIRNDTWISAMTKQAKQVWNQVIESGLRNGFRNAQATVLAPTGTIGFMMDCDTTGVEPDIALVKYKQLAGGGTFKIVNQTLTLALTHLNYTDEQVKEIIRYVNKEDTIENAPHINPKHLPIFDCAFKPKNGTRFIDYHSHLKMMAAVQPFLSGAISKTVNMPNSATEQDIIKVFIDGWKMGLKAVAIYRDGSKGIQPISTGKDKNDKLSDEKAIAPVPKPFRRNMPTTRKSITHKFEVAGHKGYLTVGLYEEGAPGELFITMAKEGSTVGGTMDAFGTAISMCLQYGVTVSTLIEKFTHSRFEPSGFTKNPEIPFAKSLVDYIFRWLAITFHDKQSENTTDISLLPSTETITEDKSSPDQISKSTVNTEEFRIDKQFTHFQSDAPVCDNCGAITVRNGSCYRCFVCGNSMGCS